MTQQELDDFKKKLKEAFDKVEFTPDRFEVNQYEGEGNKVIITVWKSTKEYPYGRIGSCLIDFDDSTHVNWVSLCVDRFKARMEDSE